jgi:hypothetical protein
LAWGTGDREKYYEKIKRGDYSPTFVVGGFSEGSPSRQASIISGEAGGIFERLEESAGSLLP